MWAYALPDWNLNISLNLQPRLSQSSRFRKNIIHDWFEEKVVSLLAILIWIILHFLYTKYFDNYLRTHGHAKLRRKYISDITWSFVFFSIFSLHILYFWNLVPYPGLNAVIVRSFLIHYTGILFLDDRACLKSLTHLLHVMFIFCPSRSSIPPLVASIFLMKNVDILILDLCKMMQLKRSIKQRLAYAEYIYIIYCIFWTYLYLVYVPNIIFTYKPKSLYESLLLYSWIITQYLDFVWLNFVRHFRSSKYPVLCLFPNPSAESLRLKRIWDRHKNSKTRIKDESFLAKKKLSETLFCAIALKKKLYRLRKSKQEKLAKVEPHEAAVNEKEE